MNPPGQITLAMIRGEPAALAALCAKRGPAVFAYCKESVGEAHAAAAAAEAFGRFRLAAVASSSVTGARQAEDLLRHGTRRAALRLPHVRVSPMRGAAPAGRTSSSPTSRTAVRPPAAKASRRTSRPVARAQPGSACKRQSPPSARRQRRPLRLPSPTRS